MLDLAAKTPVREIHLYDGDTLYQHNAFRSPGAPSGEELRAGQPKATYFKNLYAKMHRSIFDHPFIWTAPISKSYATWISFLCASTKAHPRN